MADLILSSSAQSSLLHVRPNLLPLNTSTVSPIRSVRFLNSTSFHPLAFASGHRRVPLRAVVPSDLTKTISGTITANCVDSGVKAVEVEPTIDYGGGGGGGIGGDKFGGGGGGGDGNDDEGKDGEEESDGKGNTPLSMSQKLTLGYAFLVGVGGLMGYLKSGSQKSLLAGGLTAAVLLYVFSQLPTKPVLASTIGVVSNKTQYIVCVLKSGGGCINVGDGDPIHGIEEDISSRSCVHHVFHYDRRIHTRYHAQPSLSSSSKHSSLLQSVSDLFLSVCVSQCKATSLLCFV